MSSLFLGGLLTVSGIYAHDTRGQLTVSLQQSAQSRKVTYRGRQQERWARVLRRTYDTISAAFAPIIEKYDVLKKVVPAEYAFYLQQLKSTITKEVKQGHIPLYNGMLSEIFHSWTLDEYQRSKEKHRSPLKKFKYRLLPEAVKALEVHQRLIKGSDLGVKVDELIEKLTDIETII